MITVKTEENNPISQNLYEEIINRLQFHRITCTCSRAGGLSIHGYYRRSVKGTDGKISLKICRVRCRNCGRTHALLLSSMVPYSQIPLKNIVEIITDYESGDSFDSSLPDSSDIDEDNRSYVLKQYLKHWKEKLLSYGIALRSLSELTVRCLTVFSRQFMQIRRTPNILFVNTT